MLHFYATAPKNIAPLLAAELRALGAYDVRELGAGVSFDGDLARAYRVCLWSRYANRILLSLTKFHADTPEQLYDGIRNFAWEDHLDPQGTLAVDCTVVDSPLTHNHYAALKTKDAIVDRFREKFGVRPSVDVERPDIRINVHLRSTQARIALDLSGGSLHRRGYRDDGAQAPLKENLAAAILGFANWPELARGGAPLLDPMCGSGTLLIEGALMAADVAPGLQREHFGFLGWKKHDAALWDTLLSEARARREAGLAKLPPIRGYDADAKTVRVARENVATAGLKGKVLVEQGGLDELVGLLGKPDNVDPLSLRETTAWMPSVGQRRERLPRDRVRGSLAEDLVLPPHPSPLPEGEGVNRGLLVANPPYGERLGDVRALPALYAQLGSVLRALPGWQAAVITGNPDAAAYLGFASQRSEELFNGPIECRLFHYAIPDASSVASAPKEISPGAQMFANRLRKNLKHWQRWARREDVHCYRVYDGDLPEYALAVDVYEADTRYVNVQEYQAPASIDPAKAQQRVQEALAVLPDVFEIPIEHVYFRVRRKQKGKAQYEKLDASERFIEVSEGGLRFLVNFTDYLDTGLFLDHRRTRALLRELASGTRFLNLFAYTGTATVYAAAGGARTTTTVDMSHTYLDWAQSNLELNGFGGPAHRFEQADCIEWIESHAREQYDLIFLDPPTFSNSKRMENTFDVQRDHVDLLRATLRLLAPGGTLIFSNNARRFKLDADALSDLKVTDITRQTLPPDFERNPRIHQCWRIAKA